MTEFNIYDFLPDNIAKYCKKYLKNFTQLEMAAIVFCSDKTVAQKHEAYKLIINNYPDTPVPPIDNLPSCPGIPGLHDLLNTIIEYEEKRIEVFSRHDKHVLYLPQLMADTGIPYQYTPVGENALFPTAKKAVKSFKELAGSCKDSIRKIIIEKVGLNRIDNSYQLIDSLEYNFCGDILNVPYAYDGEFEGDSAFYYIYFYHYYSDINLQIPPIKLLTDTSIKDAVFALLTEMYKKDFEADMEMFIKRYDEEPETFNFDFDSVTELELIMPESLENLRYFLNLERLIICRPPDCKHSNALNAGILACPTIDNLCITDFGGKLREVVIKRDLG